MLGQQEGNLSQKLSQFRAKESWPYYDTVQIRSNFPEPEQDEGYQSYAALGNANVNLALFGQKRKRSTIGAAYSNLEVDSFMSYGMYVVSAGVSFKAPSTMQGRNLPAQMIEESAVFMADIPKHTGCILRINQDEKLVTTQDLIPEGTGYSGGTFFEQTPDQSSTTTVQSGVPALTNRFRFPKPMKLMRGTIITLQIEFSSYAKQVLRGMLGPGNYDWVDAGGNDLDPPVPRCSTIRASFLGAREAQLRDAYVAG